MKTAAFAVLAAVAIILVDVVGTVEASSNCPKFSKISDRSEYVCPRECSQPSFMGKDDVFGTEYYTEDSLVCLAARHMGRIDGDGGRVSFSTDALPHNITGTLRNRIVSQSMASRDGMSFFHFNTDAITQDEGPDIIIVHDSYSNGQNLYLTCLADDKNRKLVKDDIMEWSYVDYRKDVWVYREQKNDKNNKCVLPFRYDGKTYWECTSAGTNRRWCGTQENVYGSSWDSWEYCKAEEGRFGIRMIIPRIENKRVVRCRGKTSSSDVFGVIQATNQLYTAKSTSLRASRNDRIEIALEKQEGKNLPDQVFVRRFPDGWNYKDGDPSTTTLPLIFDPVTPSHAGLYILGNDETRGTTQTTWKGSTKTAVEGRGAYLHVIVRDCEADRYGKDCGKWCRDCLNGGVCRASSGTCLCPPGFMGPACEKACDRGKFGSSCQLTCDSYTLRLSPERNGQCLGLTFCLPEPYGCSCASGYTGPFCQTECATGWYGAGCLSECKHCKGNQCNSFSGKCTKGCKDGVSCKDGIPEDLPRLRERPRVTNVKKTSAVVSFSAWDQYKDDGAPKFRPIRKYLIQMKGERRSQWVTKEEITPTSQMSATVEDLEPGSKYFVRVIVVTDSGKIDGTTNQRVQEASFTTLCPDPEEIMIKVDDITQTTVFLNSTGAGSSAHCPVNYTLEMRTADGEESSKTITEGDSVTLEGLSPDTHYDITIVVINGFGRSSKSLDFTTLPNPPKEPTDVRISREKDQLTLTWTLPEDSPSADNFSVSYQFLQHIACDEQDLQAKVKNTTTLMSFTVNQLQNFSEYEMCVAATNEGGTSDEVCAIDNTLSDVPQVTLDGKNCTSRGLTSTSTTCIAQVLGTCTEYNGPGFAVEVQLKTNLECKQTNSSVLQVHVEYQNWINARFDQLIPGQRYEATMIPLNAARRGTPSTTFFTTKESVPPKVRNLTALPFSSSEIRLFFRNPCPTNGPITHLIYAHSGQSGEQRIPANQCQKSNKYDYCIDIDGLSLGKEYTFKVAVENSAGRGEFSEVKGIPKECKPGPPELNNLTRADTSVTVHLLLPSVGKGKELNCHIRIDNVATYHGNVLIPEEESLDILIDKLTRGRRYEAEAFCCNSEGCGESLNLTIATTPADIDFISGFGVKSKTNTSITLSLPQMEKNGEGNRSLAILVKHIARGIDETAVTNFTKEFLRLRESRRDGRDKRSLPMTMREKREVSQTCEESHNPYIAGVLYEDVDELDEFTVGTGDSKGLHPNCPLTPQEKYQLGLVAEVNLEGESRFSEKKIKGFVVAEFEDNSGNAAMVGGIVSFLLILLILIVLAIVFRDRLKAPKEALIVWFTNVQGGEDEPANDMPRAEISKASPPRLPIQVPAAPYIPEEAASPPPRPPPQEENIYANIEVNAVYGNLFQCIPRQEIEAYLCQTVNSYEVSEEFQSVDPIFKKSMDYGAHPENKKKNRFRNNLPYDETRVKLSFINEDPFSDYINANHVFGLGGPLKFIATQGPKDQNLNTLEDFWRMILEQEVTAIIMVANFVEGGKKKVGEYFDYEQEINIGGYTVTVPNTWNYPKYNISEIQVTNGILSRTVTHYHYTKWPDHGVPTETYTLGSMLRTVINSELKGCILVHCSAGIGRTGTVLMVLLLKEMLEKLNGIQPVEALKRLRGCRARLVENVIQYNLALKLFEEVEFGALHTVDANDLQRNLSELLKEVGILHSKAKAFPFNLTFSSASNSEYAQMNRNSTVFPSDFSRIYLQMVQGQGSSQYINAVMIEGTEKSSSVIVTEHPLKDMISKFWRLVIERKCHSIVFINSFEGFETEFPTILPQEGWESVLGRFSLNMQDVASYDSLTKSKVKIVSQEDEEEQLVTVYQITSWPYGRELPPSPDALLGVCDLILKNPSVPGAGPALFTCGDGVTGCGLMAGLINIVDQLRRYGETNVYRILLRMLRVRPEFFTSPAQLEFLYKAACIYIETYSNY